MANGWGGKRPGAGRPRKHPLTGADLMRLLDQRLQRIEQPPAAAATDREILRAIDALRRSVDALAREQEHVPIVLRHVVEIRHHLGLTELHRPAGHSRRRPLGVA